MTAMGLTTNLTVTTMAMKIFGRLEDGAFEFEQHHVDGIYDWPMRQFSPADEAGYGAIFPLDMNFFSGFLDLCVSVLAYFLWATK